jgi:serine/threonine-protein kinase RsbW
MNKNNKMFTIESRTEKLSAVREFISRAARDFGFDEESISKIALAVDEACTNIIKHAYHFATDQVIDIKVIEKNGTFEVIIRDEGIPFDPNEVRLPDMNEYLKSYKRGGLGMHLMKSLMDIVEYKTFRGGNEVRLVKYLSNK